MSETYRVHLAKERLVFSAAHFITYGEDVCERLHGHNYHVTATVWGPLETNQYVIDFIVLRDAVCRWPIVGRLAVQGANAFSLSALRMTLARRRRLEPKVAQAYLAPYHNWRRRAAVFQFVRDIPLSPRHPTWQTLAKIESGLSRLDRLPILLIWGMRDWCFTPSCLEKFVSFWPNAKVERLEDVGHWVVEDAPDEVMELLGDWLKRSAPDVG